MKLVAEALNPICINWTYEFRHNRLLFTLSTPKTVAASFTISYSEFLDAFESFYSFTPNMYMSVGRRLLSHNPSNMSEVNMHDKGTYGSFYAAAAAQSYVTVLLIPKEGFIKSI